MSEGNFYPTYGQGRADDVKIVGHAVSNIEAVDVWHRAYGLLVARAWENWDNNDVLEMIENDSPQALKQFGWDYKPFYVWSDTYVQLIVSKGFERSSNSKVFWDPENDTVALRPTSSLELSKIELCEVHEFAPRTANTEDVPPSNEYNGWSGGNSLDRPQKRNDNPRLLRGLVVWPIPPKPEDNPLEGLNDWRQMVKNQVFTTC